MLTSHFFSLNCTTRFFSRLSKIVKFTLSLSLLPFSKILQKQNKKTQLKFKNQDYTMSGKNTEMSSSNNPDPINMRWDAGIDTGLYTHKKFKKIAISQSIASASGISSDEVESSSKVISTTSVSNQTEKTSDMPGTSTGIISSGVPENILRFVVQDSSDDEDEIQGLLKHFICMFLNINHFLDQIKCWDHHQISKVQGVKILGRPSAKDLLSLTSKFVLFKKVIQDRE